MGTKNIYGEVRINDEIVATQDWVAANAGGSEKEVIITNVLEMYENQDVDRFLELSNRAITGDCIIIALYAGMTAIVDSCVQYSEGTFEWRGTIFNHSGSADGVFVSPVVTAFQLASHAGELLELVIEEFPLGGVDKAYVDDNFIANPKPPSNSVLLLNGDGTVSTAGYTNSLPFAGQFCRAASEGEGDSIGASTGYFLVNNPTRPYHAANKKYVDEKIAFSDELKSVGTISSIVTHDSDYFVFRIQSLVYSIQVGNTIYIGADKTPILVDRIQLIAGMTQIRTKQGVTLPEFTANVGDAVYIQEVSTIDGYLIKDTTAREEIAKIKQQLGIE